MKIKTLCFVASLFMATSAQAQVCGMGKIVDMKDGGWNQDGLAIQLEGPSARPSGADLRAGGGGRLYVFFDASTLSAERLEGIKRIAALAIATGKTVWTNAHTGSCRDATEISIFAP